LVRFGVCQSAEYDRSHHNAGKARWGERRTLGGRARGRWLGSGSKAAGRNALTVADDAQLCEKFAVMLYSGGMDS
jgi:hypothetical protein